MPHIKSAKKPPSRFHVKLGREFIAALRISYRKRPLNQSVVKFTLSLREEKVKNLANFLFFFVKNLEQFNLITIFRKQELPKYLNFVQVLQRIQMPAL
jgi:hypothetical protein